MLGFDIDIAIGIDIDIDIDIDIPAFLCLSFTLAGTGAIEAGGAGKRARGSTGDQQGPRERRMTNCAKERSWRSVNAYDGATVTEGVILCGDVVLCVAPSLFYI